MAPSSFSETFHEIHPIDIVERLAESHNWDFDRVHDDQITMVVEGQWRTYSVTIDWSTHEDILRLICSFEMEPNQEKTAALFKGINLINEYCCAGTFNYLIEHQLMLYRYGLILDGVAAPTPEQVDAMIGRAVFNSERFYPAFQLMTWGDTNPEEAIKTAIGETYGRA